MPSTPVVEPIADAIADPGASSSSTIPPRRPVGQNLAKKSKSNHVPESIKLEKTSGDDSSSSIIKIMNKSFEQGPEKKRAPTDSDQHRK